MLLHFSVKMACNNGFISCNNKYQMFSPTFQNNVKRLFYTFLLKYILLPNFYVFTIKPEHLLYMAVNNFPIFFQIFSPWGIFGPGLYKPSNIVAKFQIPTQIHEYFSQDRQRRFSCMDINIRGFQSLQTAVLQGLYHEIF